jgi:hypothetical protein
MTKEKLRQKTHHGIRGYSPEQGNNMARVIVEDAWCGFTSQGGLQRKETRQKII